MNAVYAEKSSSFDNQEGTLAMWAKLSPEEMRERMQWYLRNEWSVLEKKLHIVDASIPDAIGVVIIFGGGYRGHVDAHHFTDVMHAYKNAGFSVLRVDMPGFGRSQPQLPGWEGQIASFAQFVRIAKSLIFVVFMAERHRGKPIITFGYSLGTIVWKLFFVLYPVFQRFVAGNISVSSPFDVDHNADRRYAALMRLRRFLRPLFFAIARAFAKKDVDAYEPDPYSIRDPLHFKRPMKMWTAYQIVSAIDRVFAKPERIVIPELYVHGRNDKIARLHSVLHVLERTATPSDKKKLIVYDNVGHLLLQEHPEAIPDIVAWSVACAKAAPVRSAVSLQIGFMERSARSIIEFIIGLMRQLWYLVWEDIVKPELRQLRIRLRIWKKGSK